MNRTSTTARTADRAGTRSRTPRDHYQDVTDRIIAALEAGTPPWRKPWDPDKAGGPAMPRNAATGHRYRGINVLTLGMSALAFESGDPRWATYKQAEERGWQVRKGERAWFKIADFWVARTCHNSRVLDRDGGRQGTVCRRPAGLRGSRALGLKRAEAQRRQPMRMAFASQQFPRAASGSLRTLAAHETAVVQEISQKVQI